MEVDDQATRICKLDEPRWENVGEFFNVAAKGGKRVQQSKLSRAPVMPYCMSRDPDVGKFPPFQLKNQYPGGSSLQHKVVGDHALNLYRLPIKNSRREAGALSGLFCTPRQEWMARDCVGRNDSPRFID